MHEYAIVNSGLAEACDAYSVILNYNPIPANGIPWNLVSTQSSAQDAQWIMTGNGVASLPLATAQTLCAPLNGKPITQDPGALNLAAGLVHYFTAIPAPAAGINSIGFIISGIQLTQLFSSKVTVVSRSGVALNNARILGMFGGGGVNLIPEPITLSPAGALLQNPNDPLSGIAYGVDELVMVPSRNLAFGSIITYFAGDPPAPGDLAILELKVGP